MTSGAVDALRADREALLEICTGLRAEDWSAPSGCVGWTVQDVVTHLGALFWAVVDPSVLPGTSGVPTEDAQEQAVATRRGWSAAQVVDDYAAVSEKALDMAASFEGADFTLPLGDLGTYHASVLPNAFTFDHYTHIRADLFGRGPLRGTPPPSDELRLRPTLDWVEVAAPQQNASTLAGLEGAVEIDVTGIAARRFVVGDGPVRAHVRCGAHDLVLWATQRATWADLGVEATGDDASLAAASQLPVF